MTHSGLKYSILRPLFIDLKGKNKTPTLLSRRLQRPVVNLLAVIFHFIPG